MRVGILGGTFNPIHIGHLILAERAYDEFDLNQVVIIPSGISYFKAGSGVIEASHRLEMARLAVLGDERFFISDIEVRRSGNSYTADTIEELHSLRAGDELFLIVGSDTLFQMESWYEPQKIFDGCTVIAALRSGASDEDLKSKIEEYKDRFGARVNVLRSSNIEISSSMIRALLRSGKSVRYYLREAVYDYITKNKLYLSAVTQNSSESAH